MLQSQASFSHRLEAQRNKLGEGKVPYRAHVIERAVQAKLGMYLFGFKTVGAHGTRPTISRGVGPVRKSIRHWALTISRPCASMTLLIRRVAHLVAALTLEVTRLQVNDVRCADVDNLGGAFVLRQGPPADLY